MIHLGVGSNVSVSHRQNKLYCISQKFLKSETNEAIVKTIVGADLLSKNIYHLVHHNKDHMCCTLWRCTCQGEWAFCSISDGKAK